MTLGILARCDTGGLAALTREVHRHLHPTRTLLIEVPDAHRGNCAPDEYIHGDVYRTEFRGALPDNVIEWAVAPGIDTLWTAETFYDDRLITRAHQQGIRTVCYTMPELAPWYVDSRPPPKPRELHVPTWWRIDTLPNAQLLPLPVARDRLPPRKLWIDGPGFSDGENLHLFHPVGTPFHDRNGTEILLAAMPFVTAQNVRLTIRTHRWIEPPKCDVDVTIVHAGDGDPTFDYWDGYPDSIDMLVMPRRYGGLSLPVQECASLGVPAVMLGTDPYAVEPFVASIPSTGSRPERMKGAPLQGIPVHSADPRVLANAIDHYARHGILDEANAAMAWAAAHAWAGPLGGRWRGILGTD